MQNQTRALYNRYLARQAELNGVAAGVQQFSVTPSVQQTLENNIQQSSAFLQLVNMIGVDEQSGEKIGLGVSGPIASRTKVATTDREPTDVSSLDDDGYECKSTEFDTATPWAMLDAWAQFPDFQRRLRNQVLQQQALDRIMIGWNGTSAATSTNIGTNTKLEDVNIGWLQKIRANAGSQNITEGGTSDQLTYGWDGGATDHIKTGADYSTLDALVFDLARNTLDDWFVDDPRIRVLVGRDLMHDKMFPLVSNYDEPTEREAADIILSSKRLGGYPAMVVPYMPAGTILITAPSNLSLYWQRGSRRRFIQDNPKRNRIEHYDSSNEAYVVEDYGFSVLLENVKDIDDA